MRRFVGSPVVASLVFGILFCSLFFNLHAQHSSDWCGTGRVLEYQLSRQPDLVQRALTRREVRSSQANKVAEQRVYRFPVVVHVIHDNGPENISRVQIESMIAVLNQAFRHISLKPDFTPTDDFGNGPDVGFEFFLARRDPQGNCSDGINRVRSPLTVHRPFNAEGQFDYPLDSTLKNLSRWDTRKYINIWVIRSMGTVGGYAYLPWESTVTDFLDGIVIRHDASGNRGTSQFFKTLAHEMGHYFGLMHPFDNGHPRMRPEQDSCGGNSPTTCRDSGDYVCDTPPSTRAFFDCDDRNTCTETPVDRIDNKENYMAYNDDRCRNMFTPGQIELMYSYLEEYRLVMTTEENLRAAGWYDSLTVEPIGVAALCANSEARREPLRLKASGAQSYTWAPATGLNRTDGPEVVLTRDDVGTFTYTVTGTGIACGTATQRVTVPVIAPRLLFITADAERLPSGLAAIEAAAGGGLQPYKYAIEPHDPYQPNFWQESSRFEDLPSGSYTVSVIDQAGCRLSTQVQVTVSRGIGSALLAGVRCYPNPVLGDRLTLEVPLSLPQALEWTLTGVDGRRVAHGEARLDVGWNRMELPLGHVPAGVWFLHIRTAQVEARVLRVVRL